jgi:hypothetical protein
MLVTFLPEPPILGRLTADICLMAQGRTAKLAWLAAWIVTQSRIPVQVLTGRRIEWPLVQVGRAGADRSQARVSLLAGQPVLPGGMH